MYNKFLGTGEQGFNPWRKIKICLAGMHYAIRYDFSVSYKFFLSGIVLLICFFFRQWLDFLLIMAATGQVLMAEMFNSAIEALCDFIETKENFKIKVIKDIAAAAAGISILIWSVIFFVEIGRLWIFLSAH
ncbi:MAG: diacylglycerol kinase [Desulfobulbaceae bacterium]